MQKTIMKTLCIFTLVFFVMSMTGAAACSSGSCSSNSCSSSSSCGACKTVAKADKFNFSPSKKCGNVLSNDNGCGLKVKTTGSLKTAKGAKVSMKSNGYFCYYPSCSRTGTITDSFTYKVVNKYGKSGTAKVTINYKCSSCSSGTCSSGTCPSGACSSCSSCKN
ncbi:MAG: Ig-like domain-containing protein [Methanosarcina sp.]|jgi:hypothetical protein